MEITQAEYNELHRDARLLRQLQVCGVDNWDGYEYVDWSVVDGVDPE